MTRPDLHVALPAPSEGPREKPHCDEGATAQECVDRRALECMSRACVYTSSFVQSACVMFCYFSLVGSCRCGGNTPPVLYSGVNAMQQMVR